MKEKKINWKDGDYFSAVIDGVRTTGRITLNGDRIYLCQNVQDGAEISDRKGFNYSWLFDEDAYNLRKISEARHNALMKRLVQYPMEIAGYAVTKYNDNWVFGCGEVVLTIEQIANFVKIQEAKTKLEEMSGHADWEEVVAILETQGIVDDRWELAQQARKVFNIK